MVGNTGRLRVRDLDEGAEADTARLEEAQRVGGTKMGKGGDDDVDRERGGTVSHLEEELGPGAVVAEHMLRREG